MPISTPVDVIALLAESREAELVGEEERPWFEAKGKPYRLDAPHQKWELAKDVSAMANSDGGLILIGARTSRPATHMEERVEEIVLVPSAMVNVDQHRKVIRDWTWPPLGSRVRLELFPREDDRALLAIEVSALPDDEQPCMVKTVARVGEGPDGREVEYWAIARRVGTATEWVPAQLVWSDIRDGRLARRNLTLPPGRQGRGDGQQIEDRVAELVTLAQATERACMLLLALPPADSEGLENFYTLEGAAGVLRRLPDDAIRPQVGFGLGFGLEVSQVGSALVTVEVDRRAVLVEPTGIAIALAVGSSDMLGWSQQDGGTAGTIRVNSYVLVEWVSEFCRLLGRLAGNDERLTGWAVEVRGLRLQSGSPKLVMPSSTHWLSRSGTEALADAPTGEVALMGDTERDAYRILHQIIGWFAMTSVPFAEEERVKAAAIQGWR